MASGCTFSPAVVGDPVDTLTGALLDRKLEFRLIGPLELSWWRHYDSAQSRQRFSLGWGQAHDFDRILYLGDERIIYGHPVGQQAWFPPLARDAEEATTAGFTLRRRSATRYELHRHGEPSVEFVFADGARRARPSRQYTAEGEIRLFHNGQNRLERIIHSTGDVLLAAQTEDGLLAELTLERSGGQRDLLLAYSYDRHGNLIRTRDGRGHGYELTYDAENRLVRRRGRKGFTFRYRYDAAGRCVFSAGDDNWYGVALTYEDGGRRTLVRRPDGGTWAYNFLPNGKLSEIVDPLGGAQKYLYDELGRATHELDPLGNVTEFVLDASGAPVRKILPTGQSLRLPEGPDPPDPRVERVATNAAEYHFGRLLDRRGAWPPDASLLSALDIPAAARALAARRPEPDRVAAQQTRYEVKPLGVAWWPAPRRGRVFNALGKLVEQHDDEGRVRRWTYDASGNLEAHTDFDGGVWHYDYGAWHLLRAVTTPIGGVTRLTYTTNEKTASFLDPRGTLSEYRYDLADRLVEVRRHGVVRETYRRDLAGNLVAKHGAGGRLLLEREIGPGNLLKRRVLASGEEHRFVYDGHGRCIEAGTKKDTVARSYDGLGRLISELRGGRGLEVRHGADGISEGIWFGRFTVRFERGEDGSLAITDPCGGRHLLRFPGGGLVVASFANGSEETSQFDDRGRCLFKDLRGHGAPAWTRRYHWSGEGELRRVEDNLLGDVLHDYDVAHRLSGRRLGETVEAYVQDSADNLLAQPGLQGVTVREGNRLAEANDVRFEYDDRNHISLCQAPAGPTTYAYDSRDLLTGATTPTGEWTADYDALGRRARKTWQGRTTEFHWFGQQLVAETSPDGGLRLYVYADALALTPILLIDYDHAEAAPESGRVGVIIADQVGAPVRVEGPNGDALWQARIAPFGAAEVAPASRIALALRFPGHFADAELGLHCNGFRHYSPTLGRYLQSDPWGTYGGTNLYAYRTNPLAEVDVRGRGEEGDKPPTHPPDDEEGTAPRRQSIQERIDEGGEPPKYARDNPDLYEFDTASGTYRRKEGEGHSRSSEFPSGYRDSTHDEMAARHTDEGRAQGGVPVDASGDPIPHDQLTWRDADGNQIPYHDADGNTNLTYDHNTSCVEMFNDGATVTRPDGTTETYPPGNNTDRATRNDFYNDPDNLTPMSRSDNSSKGGGGQTYNDNPPGPDYEN